MDITDDSTTQKPERRKSKVNTSSESREKVLIELAMDAVEERIKSGKASASEYVHFLKLGTEQAKLEREKLRNENKLLEAKTFSIEQSADLQAKFDKAMQMFSVYHGDANLEFEDDEDDEEEYSDSRHRRRRR